MTHIYTISIILGIVLIPYWLGYFTTKGCKGEKLDFEVFLAICNRGIAILLIIAWIVFLYTMILKAFILII